LLAAASRAPSIFQELPPYMFCDEEALFYADVVNMVRNDSPTSTMFRSGPMNVYPIWAVVSVVQIFIPLTDLQILLIGRIMMPFGLGSLAVIPLALFLKNLTGLRYVGLVAGALYVSSSSLTAISRIWYPDHYIFFFVSLVAMLSAQLILSKRPRSTALLLAFAFSMMISVKYHSGVLLVMVVFAYLQRYSNPANSKHDKTATVYSFLLFLLLTSVFTGTIHLNSLANWESFVEQQVFNVQNYGQVTPDPAGSAIAYTFVALLLLGPLGIIGAVAGLAALVRRRSFWTLGLLGLTPVALIVVLGIPGLFVNRNIVPAAPLLIALAAIGVVSLAVKLRRLERQVFSCFASGLALLLVLGQLALAAFPIAQDLRPDSRLIAESWIRQNLPLGVPIGTNQFCVGYSPAVVAGREIIVDPRMEQALEIYVFDSLGPSAIDSNFRGPSGSAAFLEPKYLHFYFLDDKQIVLSLAGLFMNTPIYIPEGYSLMEKFEHNGPEVWVLKKDATSP
jgi:hypothetical protein